MTEYTDTPRHVTRTVRGLATRDGAGVKLTRYIGTPDLDMVDPFLMLDVFESDRPDDYIAGFPLHPHRGFETVTYMLAGRMRHTDSTGREGVIETGGVQWMTAGRGIVHSEMPEQEEGLLKGIQLWVNLPRTDKMTAPNYREFGADALPREAREGVDVAVVTGTTSEGTRGPVEGVATEPMFLDVRLAEGGVLREPLPAGHAAFFYVVDGEVRVEAGAQTRTVSARSLAVLSAGDQLVLTGTAAHNRLLLVAARPLHEPVARGGPFVMNTRAELVQAAQDFHAGRFV